MRQGRIGVWNCEFPKYPLRLAASIRLLVTIVCVDLSVAEVSC